MAASKSLAQLAFFVDATDNIFQAAFGLTLAAIVVGIARDPLRRVDQQPRVPVVIADDPLAGLEVLLLLRWKRVHVEYDVDHRLRNEPLFENIQTVAHDFITYLIGDPTLADGILDRLVHNAHRIEMRSDSMRKNRGKPKTTYRLRLRIVTDELCR